MREFSKLLFSCHQNTGDAQEENCTTEIGHQNQRVTRTKTKDMANLSADLVNIKLTASELITLQTGIANVKVGITHVERSLNKEERTSLSSLGGKRKVMAQEALQEANLKGAILPPAISTTRLENDLDLYVQLDQLESELKDLLIRVQDSKRVAGHEAFTMATAIYNFFRSLAEVGVSGAQQSADRLGRHFRKGALKHSSSDDYTKVGYLPSAPSK